MIQADPTHRAAWAGVLAGVLGCLLAAAPTPASSADPSDADWPCIQRKLPEIDAGMVWAGPPLDAADRSWRDDAEIARLAGELSARSLPLEQAVEEAERFADGLGQERQTRLTRLFAAVLQTINRERAQIIAGIERYTRRQRALAQRIEETGAALNALADDGQAARRELEEQQAWDIRIYQEREHSLKYLCQQPVDLEQRLFQLARAIAGKLG